MTKAELEARRDSMCANLEPEIIGCLACHGFDFAAALLQGETNASNKLADKNAAACELLSQEINRLRNQLQSANAKLAVAKEALNMSCKCMYDIIGGHHGRPYEEVLRSERCVACQTVVDIAAMDASEGNGKE